MATKTITIDVDAYKRLKGAKRKNESFSQTIKRVVPSRIDVDEWIRSLESNPVSDDFVEAVEHQVTSRRAGLPKERDSGIARHKRAG